MWQGAVVCCMVVDLDVGSGCCVFKVVCWLCVVCLFLAAVIVGLC